MIPNCIVRQRETQFPRSRLGTRESIVWFLSCVSCWDSNIPASRCIHPSGDNWAICRLNISLDRVDGTNSCLRSARWSDRAADRPHVQNSDREIVHNAKYERIKRMAGSIAEFIALGLVGCLMGWTSFAGSMAEAWLEPYPAHIVAGDYRGRCHAVEGGEITWKRWVVGDGPI